MDSIAIDEETFLTGSEGLNSLIDERTLAWSPAPVAASTILRESRITRPRAPLDFGGSFFSNNGSVTHGEEDNESSLGLLPSNCFLEMENDLLPRGNICSQRKSFVQIDTPAVSQSSINNSSKNQLLDSASSKEYTSDSHEFVTTVKKFPQAGTSVREEGRYVPHVLFPNVEEVDETRMEDSTPAHSDLRKKHTESLDVDDSQKNSDSGMGQTDFTGSQRLTSSGAMSSGLGVQVLSSTKGDNDVGEKVLEAGIEQEEADHTIHQVELEAEDLEELEETFSDFDGSSDEEKSDNLAHDGGDSQKHNLSNFGDLKERCIDNSSPVAKFSAFPSMDGPFKVPLPPTKQPAAPLKMSFGTPVSTARSSKEREASMTFGDSIQLHQSGSVREWGPSIDFGSSTHISFGKDMHSAGTPVSTAISSKEREVSMTFGDSIQLHQSGSVREWGPSIDFGSSTHISFEKDMHSAVEEENKDATKDIMKPFDDIEYTKNPGKTTGIVGNPFEDYLFGEIKNGSKTDQSFFNATERGGKVCDNATRNLCPFGDLPGEISSDENGYDLLAGHNPFTDLAGELSAGGFGEDDFMQDSEAIAVMLAKDEQMFRKDNLSDDAFNSTMESVRGVEQTFMNMTIGTYMAVGSGEHGSLTSYNKRPEFGMQVKSPSAFRPGVSILSSDEISRKDENDSILGQSQLSLTEGKDDSNITSNEITLSSIYKLLDRSDLSFADPAQLILSEYNKKMLQKEETRRSKITTSQIPVEREQDRGTSLSKGAPQLPVNQIPVEREQDRGTSLSKRAPQLPVNQIPVEREQDRGTSLSKGAPQLPVNQIPVEREQDRGTGLSKGAPQLAVNQIPIEREQDRGTGLSKGAPQLPVNQIPVEREQDRGTGLSKGAPQLAVNQIPIEREQDRGTGLSKGAPQLPVNQIPVEREQDRGTGLSKGAPQLPVTSQSSRKDTHSPQRPIDKHPSPQTSTGQSNKDFSTPTLSRSHIQTAKHQTVDTELRPSTDYSNPGINNPQLKRDKSSTFATGLLPSKNIPTPGSQSSNSQADNTQKVEMQRLQTDKILPKPATHPSQSQKDQTVEIMPSQANINVPIPETRRLESKTIHEKTPLKIDLAVASKDFRPVAQRGSDYLSAKRISSSELDRQDQSTISHKNIPLEKKDNRQRNIRKDSSTELKNTAPLLQARQVVSSVPEDHTKGSKDHIKDGNLSLECITINSHDSMSSNLTNITVSNFEASSSMPALLKEKITQLSVAKPLKNAQSPPDNLNQLLNVTAENTAHYDMSDMSQFHSLIHDNTNSFLQSTAMQDKFVSSTPLSAHPPGIQNFTNTQMMEKTILPIITPRTALNILDVPESVYMPEVCCVLLSQQTSFTVTNLLDRGVKCQLTIREVTFKGQRISNNLCPFELKRQVILSPNSSEDVQVIFRPKDQGEFVVGIEIFSRNMTNPQENRTYILHISAYAEFPSLRISPSNDEIDFGELLWGSTARRSVRIQNVGRATIPLRFSIFRKESTLCNFSFYPENQTDVSSISMTTRPAAVGSVYPMSLPGRKDGQKFATETVNIYCHAKEPQNVGQKYLEKAERYQGILSLQVDMPIEDICSLNEMKLHVTVGMYKLHVDRDILPISAAPGKSGQGTIKIINSGNIPMGVDISLEPQRDHFSLNTNHVVVPSGENCQVSVTFTPQPTREEQGDNKVNLMLQNQVTQHYISVIGKVKTTQTKISGSYAVNFGGVELGHSQKQKFSFFADNDDDIKVWIKNPGSVFKLLNEDGAIVESLEISVLKGLQYTVWMVFSPLEVIGYSTDLMLQILYANRYAIPISGYGGCSKLLIEKVNEAQTGDRWLDIGCLNPGTSIIRKITVRNTGKRCCFIKASFYDVSRQEFQPFRATVMPSSLILPVNEATDLLVMVNPSQKEADLCKFGRAFIGIIKLSWGDEITRQHFVSNPGNQSRHLVKVFDIPLTSTQREIVDTELKSMSPPVESYSLLKKAMSVIKIGIFGNPAENQSATSSSSRAETDASRTLPQQRSVLVPVNPNVKPIDRSKDDWTVTPSEIHLSAGASQVKDFIQIINFSTNELKFSVEHDEGITVVPTKTAVKPKNTTMLVVSGDLAHFSRKEPAARCGLIKVQCSQQIKYVNVYVQVTPGRLLSPMPSLSPSEDTFVPLSTTNAVSATLTSGRVKKTLPRPPTQSLDDPDTPNSSVSSSGKKVPNMRIQGSDMTIFPTADVGTKRDQTYFFTNISTDPLTWELASFAPAYVKHADNTQNLYRVNYDVFKLSPLTGVLQPDETEKVSIKFCPQSKGSYNQAWCIYDTSDGQSHRFSVYAKASSGPLLVRGHSEQDSVPKGLSPTHGSTSPRGSYTQGTIPGQFKESFTPSREVNTTEPSRSLERSSSGHHFSKAGTKLPVTTAQSNLTIQNPSTPPLHPGVSWRPVPQSEQENVHRSTAGNKFMNIPTNSGETNVSHNAMKETESSLEGFKSLQPSCSQQPNASGDGDSSRSEKENAPKIRGLHLVHDVIEFPKLHAGESTVLKIYLKNLSNEDTQVVIEYEPKPPFLIKHYNFKVGKDKMVMFPVTFKPRHVAEFKDKVVFRDTRTGNSFTAVLDAECVNKLATS